MAFAPIENKTIAASTSSAQQSFSPAEGSGITTLRVFNSSAVVAFVKWGKGPQTATVNDVACQPGWTHFFDKGEADTVAAILASGTGNVYIARGVGDDD